MYEEIEACHEACTSATCEEGPGSPCDNNPVNNAIAETLCMYLNGVAAGGRYHSLTVEVLMIDVICLVGPTTRLSLYCFIH